MRVNNTAVNARLGAIREGLLTTSRTLAARSPGSRNILITGAGNVGSNIGLALLMDPRFNDYNVHFFDNMSSGHRRALEIMNIHDHGDMNGAHGQNSGANGGHLFIGDLKSYEAIDNVIGLLRPELVVHTAAYISVPESVKDPGKYWAGNYQGALNLYEAMQRHGVTKALFSQTAACYDGGLNKPLNEDDPFNPNNPYGETKAAIAQSLRRGTMFPDIDNISLHYFNVCGAPSSHMLREDHGLNTEGHLIPIIWQVAFYNLLTRFGLDPVSLEGFIRDDVIASYGEKRSSLTIFGNDFDTEDGTCVRDYIGMQLMTFYHLEAIARLLSSRRESRYEAFNLGTMMGNSNKQVVNTFENVIRQELGFPVMGPELEAFMESPQRIIPVKMGGRREGDPGFLVADPTRAQTVLAKGLDIPQLTLKDFLRDAFWSMLFRPMGYGDNPNIVH